MTSDSSKPTRPTLGVLGGMGPLATVDFLGKVIAHTPATCDQDHIPVLAYSATQVPDRTMALAHEGTDPLPALIEAALKLQNAGAAMLAMPCNTAHHWHEQICREIDIPFLHMIRETAMAALSFGVSGKVGLLATTGTVISGLYPKVLEEFGLACELPDSRGQERVMSAVTLIKGGQIDRAREILAAQEEKLLARNVEAVILGCTEFPLALVDTAGTEVPRIDAQDCLALAAVRELAVKEVL